MAAAAAAALWLFVETPSLFYPNMSCHHNNRIVDFCPCLKHTTNRFTRTYARIHIMYVTMTTAVITCYYRHPHFRPHCRGHSHNHHRSSHRCCCCCCCYHTFRHEKPHHQSPAQIWYDTHKNMAKKLLWLRKWIIRHGIWSYKNEFVQTVHFMLATSQTVASKQTHIHFKSQRTKKKCRGIVLNVKASTTRNY